MFLGVRGGVYAAGGRHIRPLFVRVAKNFRFKPGDSERLWGLLGRSKFNATPIGASADPAADDTSVKSLFAYQPDTGDQKLVVHKGGSLWEAIIALTGSFSEAVVMDADVLTPRGGSFAYREKLYYVTPRSNPGIDFDDGAEGRRNHFWVRESSGWVRGGFQELSFAYLILATPTGVGTLSSTTQVLYTGRLYDTNTKSEGPPLFTGVSNSFTNVSFIRLTFASGITNSGARGTHLRIYRSVFNEPPGIKYRVDGAGDGIPIADVVVGYNFDDDTTQDEAILNGKVRADGEEGSLQWAEHGGEPPVARGGIIFDNHLVVWGVEGNEDRIYYSAQGYPENFPIDAGFEYQYYMTMATSKQDKVMACALAGPYLLVLNENSIWRVTKLPTYTEPGFDRRIQDTLSAEHGCAAEWGVSSFGIGPEESSYCVYVSREHGPMLTNGVFDRPILDAADWENAHEPSKIGNTVIRNYPKMQEVWIAYTPKGGTVNTKAWILDYSDQKLSGVRVTGPVTVKMDDAGSFHDGDSVPRFFLMGQDAATIYVQDNGTTDAQQNVNAAGDLDFEIEFPRARLGRDPFHTGKATKLSVEGNAGAETKFTVTMVTQDGREEYETEDEALVGPGETNDLVLAGVTGNGHRATISYQGPTGSTYDEADAACAPAIRGIRWLNGATGVQKRTS